MKIQKTDGQNKINFQSIHAIKNAEKKCGINTWDLLFNTTSMSGAENEYAN